MVTCRNGEEHGWGWGLRPAHPLLPCVATCLRVSPRPLLATGLGHTARLTRGREHQWKDGVLTPLS